MRSGVVDEDGRVDRNGVVWLMLDGRVCCGVAASHQRQHLYHQTILFLVSGCIAPLRVLGSAIGQGSGSLFPAQQILRNTRPRE